MVVTIEQIQKGVDRFMDEELGKKAVGFDKFSIYFISSILINKIPKIIHKFKDNDLAEDFFDDDGNVNIDLLYNKAKFAISKSGQFSFKDIIFNETDVDKLYTYIIKKE